MKHRLASLLLPATLLGLTACNSADKPAAQSSPTPPADTTTPAPAPAAATTDTARFEWDGEMCHNVGYYPTGRYTAAQLRDSRALVDALGILLTDSPRRPEQLHPDTLRLRLQQLAAEYRQQQQALQRLRVVPVAYWQQLQQLRLQELAEDYALRQRGLQSYLTPQVLTATPGTAACASYTRVLASTDTTALLRAWRQLVDEQKLHNGAPEHLEAQYQQRRQSAERLAYARLDLTEYGWWNCVNGAKKHGEVRNLQEPDAAFARLFARVVPDCEDVD